MMTETGADDSTESASVPDSVQDGFLDAVADGYVDVDATTFHEDGTARIVLTHTHQGAFKVTSRAARRFGLIPDAGNKDAGGQTWRHISGTTPTVRVTYKPDRYNVVMVGNPDYTGPLPYDPHPVKSAVSFADAVEHAEHARENYRDDVEYRVQSCETQELIAREDEQDDDGPDTRLEVTHGPGSVSDTDVCDLLAVPFNTSFRMVDKREGVPSDAGDVELEHLSEITAADGRAFHLRFADGREWDVQRIAVSGRRNIMGGSTPTGLLVERADGGEVQVQMDDVRFIATNWVVDR